MADYFFGVNAEIFWKEKGRSREIQKDSEDALMKI